MRTLGTSIRRCAAMGVATAIVVLGVGGANPAGAAANEALVCDPENERPLVDTSVVINCVHQPGPAASQDEVTLGLELLETSVNDTDGSALPADHEQPTDSAGRAPFRLGSKVPGSDFVCIWVQRDGDTPQGDPLCLGGDNANTELVHLEWARTLPTPAPPVTAVPLGAAPPSDGAAAPTSTSETLRPGITATSEDGASAGFVLVADRELSLAIDAALVALAALVLWRSRWVRAVVVDSLRHPRTPSWVERDGTRRATRDPSRPPRDTEL